MPVTISSTRRAFLFQAICAALILSAGCASYAPYSARIKTDLAEGKFGDALKEIDEADLASSDLLTFYDTGLVLHYAGRFEESNRQFHQAEALYEDLYTKSVSQEVGSMITSDAVINYRGERFEAAFIHYYKILNYLHLGDGQGALVECRKLNEKLKVFHDAGGTFYVDDPFLQYLTGIVYESEGELPDAWVSYRQALAAYRDPGDDLSTPLPSTLECDLQRVNSLLGYGDEAPEDKSRDPCPQLNPESGGAVLLLETGFVPPKAQVQLVAPIFEGEINKDLDRDKFSLTLAERARREKTAARKVSYWLTIAFPDMVPEPTYIDEVEVVAVEVPTSAGRASLAADIGAATLKRFEERRFSILAKSLARALAKYLAKEKVEDKQGQLAGMLVNVFAAATEQADTRSWSTLPGRIYLARLSLPAGSYTLQVTLRDSAGKRLETIAIPEVEIEAGRVSFHNHRVF